jgi:hypothetical protein
LDGGWNRYFSGAQARAIQDSLILMGDWCTFICDTDQMKKRVQVVD